MYRWAVVDWLYFFILHSVRRWRVACVRSTRAVRNLEARETLSDAYHNRNRLGRPRRCPLCLEGCLVWVSLSLIQSHVRL
ncbi:uncharacterized protein BDV14DRAFT_165789 [Aspergillus stella-maris]|uniref:uncharacterized protein n=1 Tax=Aspergillus stella-maris TaxID=1810926 RepID=UPI003CCD100B